MDVNIARLASLVPFGVAHVPDAQQHAALVLVEPLGCLVDVEVCSLVGAADDHDGHAGFVVDAVVVDWGCEFVCVFGDPAVEC